MIRKVVITAAGLGTRLLPATKETPKEMLPIFVKNKDGQLYMKPLLQIIFEDLCNFGIREYVFISGRGKRSIEDHFTPDDSYIRMLRNIGKQEHANELESFYSLIRDSKIFWTFQPEPKGFGDAVSLAEPFVNKEEQFIIFAGDTYMISPDQDYLRRLVDVHEKYKPVATLFIFEVDDPRMYGVVTCEPLGNDAFRVKEVVEKPTEPKSKYAILPVYIFDPIIFKALKKITFGKGNEKQLTDGIQKLIDWGFEVCAVKLLPNEKRLDIGSVSNYAEALCLSGKEAEINFNDFEKV